MASYFTGREGEVDQTLLELKFREIILTLADSERNDELLSYFIFLTQEPGVVPVKSIMEENYCFNLKLVDYAKLSNRSLSTFKRDFQKVFGITPGKWLMEKRLNHAMHLMRNMDKTVSEAAFESGFENISHFSRSFRNRFKIAPARLKQRRFQNTQEMNPDFAC